MRRQYIRNQVQYDQPRNYTKFIFLLILIVAIAGIVAIAFISLTPKKTVCGDNVCDSSENCYDCPIDCKCSTNGFCNQTTKKCDVPRCGNGVCEPFENMENCCNDCGCQNNYQTCNTTSHVCEMPQATISDQKVRELATEYYTNQSKTISEFGLISTTVYQNKPAKSIGVKLQGEYGVHILIVTDDEQVIERLVN